MTTARSRRLPNFFLLGAGRSGSTTLHRMLARHPRIFMSRVKEPTFFIKGFHITDNAVDYADLFCEVTDQTTIGEASHAYLSHPDAARTLYSFFPEARFVVILRNPADRAHSLYCWMADHGYESAPSFEAALRLEDRRIASSRFASTCHQYFWNYMYFRSGLFGTQIERYFDFFPPDTFHFTTLRRLLDDPVRTQVDMHRFLGLEPHVVDLAHENKTRGVRSPAISVFEQRWVRPASDRGIPGTTRAAELIRRFNARRVRPIDPRTRAALLARYGPDLDRTRELTGLDLRED